ncbi:MAG: YjbH domain-containing protein, partial [Planktomarina sp.]|nr:YjbH domain-containing protein [Planktomarina sp.]
MNMSSRELKLLNLKPLNSKFLRILFLMIASSASPLIAQNFNGFGFPGLVELPTARHMPAGELVFQQKLDRSLHRSNIMFQLTPNIATAFRYVGQGRNSGNFYGGRHNWDRSFDLHIRLLEEQQYRPELSFGMRDFVGTGWYTSEYVVATKKYGPLDLTVGLGFGRLAGRNKISNPFAALAPKLKSRGSREIGLGGELEFGQWFSGPASTFFGAKIQMSDKVAAAIEYNPDLMLQEAGYLSVKSPINVGINYQLNESVELGVQKLHGNTFGVTASMFFNPKRPPNGNGFELAPVPMRARSVANNVQNSPEKIKSVLKSEGFLLKGIQITGDTIRVDIENQEFRSVAQAVGRITRTLQRFSSDRITKAKIVFIKHTVPVASYEINFNEAEKALRGQKSRGVFKPKDVASALPVDDLEESNF